MVHLFKTKNTNHMDFLPHIAVVKIGNALFHTDGGGNIYTFTPKTMGGEWQILPAELSFFDGDLRDFLLSFLTEWKKHVGFEIIYSPPNNFIVIPFLRGKYTIAAAFFPRTVNTIANKKAGFLLSQIERYTQMQEHEKERIIELLFQGEETAYAALSILGVDVSSF